MAIGLWWFKIYAHKSYNTENHQHGIGEGMTSPKLQNSKEKQLFNFALPFYDFNVIQITFRNRGENQLVIIMCVLFNGQTQFKTK